MIQGEFNYNFLATELSILLDRLSPNIQVSSGVHNVEGQYIKASKNISSIFAGFAHTFHKDNPGLLPTLLTLLLNQCLDQAATVSIKKDKSMIYVKNLVNSGIKDNPPTFEYEIEIIDYQKFKDNLKKIIEDIYIKSIKYIDNIPFYCKLNEKKYILDIFHDIFPIHLNRVPNVKSFEIKHS